MFFFFNDTATTEIYTLSLHDALPILGRPGEDRQPRHRRDAGRRRSGVQPRRRRQRPAGGGSVAAAAVRVPPAGGDRKSTRLNSSHANISYAVFCLKKKNKIT